MFLLCDEAACFDRPASRYRATCFTDTFAHSEMKKKSKSIISFLFKEGSSFRGRIPTELAGHTTTLPGFSEPGHGARKWGTKSCIWTLNESYAS